MYRRNSVGPNSARSGGNKMSKRMNMETRALVNTKTNEGCEGALTFMVGC
jgi:hypothetical protein